MFSSLIDGIRAFIGAGAPSGEEARDKARVLCRYAVNCAAKVDGQPFPASVVDVSRTGMRLEGVATVSKGDNLWISYTDASDDRGDVDMGPVHVEVMWSRKRPHDGVRLAGVRYADMTQLKGTWVQSVLTEVGLSQEVSAFQKRKHIRLATALRAELRDNTSGEHLAEGKVSNLSVGGILVQSESSIRESVPVLVMVSPYNNFPIFSVPAQVLNCRYDPDEGQYFISLQFVSVNAQQLKTLKKFVFNLLKGRSIG